MSGERAGAAALAGVGLLVAAVLLEGAGAAVVGALGAAIAVAGVVLLVRGGAAGTEKLRREAADAAAGAARRLADAEEDRRSLEGILEAMDEGILLVEGGEVGFANPAAGRLVGVSGRGGPLLVPGLRRLLERAAVEGPAQEELPLGYAGRVVLASAMPAGPSGRVLLVLRDVTEARRVEEVRRDFVADASHELKTPVSAIRATAETLREVIREDPEEAGRFADRLARDAVRLSRIVADLLDLSRLETQEPGREPVRLDRVVRDASDRVRGQADEAGIALEVDLDSVTVEGDRKDLGLLLANLLDNAVRYTGRGGRVRVELRTGGGRVFLTISDTGVGIPSRDLPRIFERFYRVDRARSRETGGTGLGLSIARHVAERHGGRVEVESELGRGSTFRVILPAVAGSASVPA